MDFGIAYTFCLGAVKKIWCDYKFIRIFMRWEYFLFKEIHAQANKSHKQSVETLSILTIQLQFSFLAPK